MKGMSPPNQVLAAGLLLLWLFAGVGLCVAGAAREWREHKGNWTTAAGWALLIAWAWFVAHWLGI